MDKKSIKDVARIAKVSTATVSRVVNNSPLVQEETKKKVLEVIQQLHYQPNLVARSLIRGKSNLLTLIVPPEPSFFAAFYFRQILCGISETLARFNYRLMIFQPEGYDPKLGYPAGIDGFQMDGIFIIAPLMNDRLVKFLEEQKSPAVLINARSKVLDWVDLDNVISARQVIEKLAQMGHRRIAHISGMKGNFNTTARLEGYKKGLEDAEIPFDENLVAEGDYALDSGKEACEKLLAMKRRPTAIFAANDFMAIGAVQSAHKHKLSVPEELSVFGFDDLDVAAISEPPLSTVRQPFYEMGRKASELLIERVRDPGKDQVSMELVGEIVMRQSVKELGT